MANSSLARWPATRTLLACARSLLLAYALPAGHGFAQEPSGTWRETATLAATEAHQAAAADERYVYAISSRTIGKYDRKTGQRIATSTPDAEHLNSGFFWQGKLYCAHSNYPARPERSEIFVLDPESMKLSAFHHFANQPGSLTWAVRHDGAWWCNFAFYDADNAQSYLARFDEQWHQQARWTYPPELVKKLGRHSLSGGLWHAGDLLATDHDNLVIYRLRVPRQPAAPDKPGAPDQPGPREQPGVLELLDIQSAPFTGQGIAHDPLTGGLVGIVRKKKLVIFAEPARR